METPQDKIREFFWELDKLLGPNHPFIVLHGPADTFKSYLESNIEDTAEGIEIRKDNWELERKVERLEDDIDTYRTTIYDVIDDLKRINTAEDTGDEIESVLSVVIQDLKDAL